MQPISVLQNSTTNAEPLQIDGSKMRAHATVLKESRSARLGLPCANCKAYYASDLSACPICKCAERVPAGEARSASSFKNPPASVLKSAVDSFINFDSAPACGAPMQLVLHSDEDEKRFLLESKLLICAGSPEIDGGDASFCILDENHNTPSNSASICLPCYERVHDKLARTEAALLIDLREAAQIVYRAVWADPSPADPSQTYQSAAQALLNELCQRAGIVRLPGDVTRSHRLTTLTTEH